MFSLRIIALATLALYGYIRGAVGFGAPAFGRAQSSSLGTNLRGVSTSAFYGQQNSFSVFARHAATGSNTRSSSSARRTAQGVRSLSATIPNDLKGKVRLEKFIGDCELLGPIRFVCMTDGAILEAVGSFDNLRYSDQSKGRYATVSEGNSFECHLNTDKVKSISMVTKPSPSGSYDLYITRFLNEKGEALLSAMLHGVEGSYEPGAAEYWKKLRTTFGAEQSVA